jgi:hypothetical protein
MQHREHSEFCLTLLNSPICQMCAPLRGRGEYRFDALWILILSILRVSLCCITLCLSVVLNSPALENFKQVEPHRGIGACGYSKTKQIRFSIKALIKGRSLIVIEEAMQINDQIKLYYY